MLEGFTHTKYLPRTYSIPGPMLGTGIKDEKDIVSSLKGTVELRSL